MRKRIVIAISIASIILIFLAALLAVAKFWLIPSLAVTEFKERSSKIDQRFGWSTTVDSIEPSINGLIDVKNIKIADENGRIFLVVREAKTSLDLWKYISQKTKVFSNLQAHDVSLSLFRDNNGNFEILNAVKHNNSKSDSPVAKKNLLERYFGGSFPDANFDHIDVKIFSPKGVEPFPVEAMKVDHFTVDGGEEATVSTKIALKSITSDQWKLPEEIDFRATVDRNFNPKTLNLDLSQPIRIGNIGPLKGLVAEFNSVSFDPSPKNDFFDPKNSIRLNLDGLALSLEKAKKPFVEIKKLQLDAENILAGIENLKIHQLLIDDARILLHRNDSGNPEMDSVRAILGLKDKPPASETNEKTADIASEKAKESDDNDDDPIDLDGQGGDDSQNEKQNTPAVQQPKSSLFAKMWSKILERIDRIPSHVAINKVNISLDDQRTIVPDNQPKEVSLDSDVFEINFDKKKSQFSLSFGFRAQQGNLPRGSGNVHLLVSPSSKKIEGKLDLKTLDLQWLGQISGPAGSSLSNYFQSGIVTAYVDLKPLEGANAFSAVEFNGNVHVEKLMLEEQHLAELPILVMDASYDFEGFFNPELEIPQPHLLKVPLFYSEDDEQQPADPLAQEKPVDPRLKKGGFVIRKGDFSLNSSKGSFTFGIYGTGALPEMLPARVDINVSIPRASIATLLNSVPDAILGPLQGIKMAGFFAWTFALELPIYRASDMLWRSEPVVENASIVSSPDDVDVRKLRGEFMHTISDIIDPDNPETSLYTRTVNIPEMMPVTAQWLIDNTGLDIDTVAQGRRRRGWPTLPPNLKSNSSPLVWLDPSLMREEESEAPEPWNDDKMWIASLATYTPPAPLPPLPTSPSIFDPEPATDGTPPTAEFDEAKKARENALQARAKAEIQAAKTFRAQQKTHVIPSSLLFQPKSDSPEGPYMYVPLAHISKYLTRAILTTEDGSFFTHDGINTRALKNSIRDNLAAGRFRRGASTISMQLAKNLFLSRDKVVARKLRELFLVWLMESVADIPKERMLELYFNIIEFGPRIFGINAASVHYFGKRPDDLSLAEVAWFVSIIPGPKKYHRYYDSGAISAVHLRRMRRYINAMYSRERITAEERDAALAEVPTFYKPSVGDSILDPYFYWKKNHKGKVFPVFSIGEKTLPSMESLPSNAAPKPFGGPAEGQAEGMQPREAHPTDSGQLPSVTPTTPKPTIPPTRPPIIIHD